MNEISAQELKSMLDRGDEVQIIDIREEHELVSCGINGQHIPMELVLSNRSIIRTDIPVVFHCKSGQRAGAVVYALRNKFGYTNVFNLSGGLSSWSEDIDPSMHCDG